MTVDRVVRVSIGVISFRMSRSVLSGFNRRRVIRWAESSSPIPIIKATTIMLAGEKEIELMVIKARVRGMAPIKGRRE